MKYISASVVSGPFGKSLINQNLLYAIPIQLESGTHVFDQAFMQYRFGNVRLAIYSDLDDYPNTLILDIGNLTSNTEFQDTQNCFYDFISPLSLTGGKYWLVCISDSEVNSASYLGQENSLMLSTIGIDVTRNDSIIGYTIPYNFLTAFPGTFLYNDYTNGPLIINHVYTISNYVAGDDFTSVGASSNANGVEFVAIGTTPTIWSNGSTLSGAKWTRGNTLIGTDSTPVILLRQISFTPGGGGGGSGISGFSGYSGSGGSGISGVSGYSGISGVSGWSGVSGYSGVSGWSGSGISGFSGSQGSLANMMAITSLRI